MHPVKAADFMDGLCRHCFTRLVEKHGGNEIGVLGRCDARGCIMELEIIAAGTKTEVDIPWKISRFLKWDCLVHNHPSGDLEPSAEDHALAEELTKFGVGFAILDNDATEINVLSPWSSARRLRYEESLRRHERIKTLIASWG